MSDLHPLFLDYSYQHTPLPSRLGPLGLFSHTTQAQSQNQAQT